MEELLWFFLDILINTLVSVPLDAALSKKDSFEKEVSVGCLFPIIFLAIGGLLGAASLWLFPHHLIPNSTMRVIYLVLAPIFVGLFSLWLAQRRGTFSLIRLLCCR